jgi:ABC-type Fe3+ transport system permease subunit
VDLRLAVLHHQLDAGEDGLIDHYIDFLGDPWNARLSTIAANIWRGVPFVAITLLAGLQTISPSLYEAGAIDGASGWQRFRFITLPLLTPIIAVVMTFSVLFTFTDFQLIYVLTRGGPLNATHLMATLSFQRAISGGALGEGAAIAIAMVPFLLAAILFSYFGLQRRQVAAEGGQRRIARTPPPGGDSTITEGMAYLSRCRGAWSRSTSRWASSCSCCCSRSTGWPSRRSSPTTSCCRATAIRSG